MQEKPLGTTPLFSNNQIRHKFEHCVCNTFSRFSTFISDNASENLFYLVDAEEAGFYHYVKPVNLMHLNHELQVAEGK